MQWVDYCSRTPNLLGLEVSPLVAVWPSASFLNSLNLYVLSSEVSMRVKGIRGLFYRLCRTLQRKGIVIKAVMKLLPAKLKLTRNISNNSLCLQQEETCTKHLLCAEHSSERVQWKSMPCNEVERAWLAGEPA